MKEEKVMAARGNFYIRNVPEGWFNYSTYGSPIRNTKIIPIKTPLKTGFNNGLNRKDVPPGLHEEKHKSGVPLEDEFTPTQLVEKLVKEFGKRLYAVIDLTYTNRYYNSKELTDLGIKYSKVKCPGREIPSKEVYTRFSRTLAQFLRESDERSLIAVHCTHGLNRTGYLLCRYLIERKKLSAETAIKDFNEARGHDIERTNYTKHLRDGCPSLPGSDDQPSLPRGHVSPTPVHILPKVDVRVHQPSFRDRESHHTFYHNRRDEQSSYQYDGRYRTSDRRFGDRRFDDSYHDERYSYREDTYWRHHFRQPHHE